MKNVSIAIVVTMTCLACALPARAGGGTGRALLIDRVVAYVAGDVLTQSGVILEAYVTIVKRLHKKGYRVRVVEGSPWPRIFTTRYDGRGAQGTEPRELAVTPAILDSTLELMINQRVVLQEADRLKFLEVEDEEKNMLLEDFKSAFVSTDDYRRFADNLELYEDELADMLAKAKRVENYIEERISLSAWPSGQELKEAYAVYQKEHPGETFEQVKDELASGLYQKRFKRKLKEWIGLLRAKSSVRIVEKPSQRPASGAGVGDSFK